MEIGINCDRKLSFDRHNQFAEKFFSQSILAGGTIAVEAKVTELTGLQKEGQGLDQAGIDELLANF